MGVPMCLRLLMPIALLFVVATQPATADDDARCVQQMLADVSYPVGTVDGQIGAKTRQAAAMLAAAYPELGLPELTTATEGQWCQVASSDAFRRVVADRAALSLVEPGDLSAGPARWTAHLRTKTCQSDEIFRKGQFDPLPAALLPAFDPSDFQSIEPIFPAAAGSKPCLANGWVAGRPPRPVVDAEITGNYLGSDFARFDPTYTFLGPAIANYRAAPSEKSGAPLKKFLVEWAEADALSVNIHAPWGAKPLDYNVMTIIPAAIIGYSEVATLMTPAESESVARWLHRLVSEALQSSWLDRQDNKAYMRSNIALLWGMLTDNEDLKQVGYSSFRNALADIRPDGSAPGESMRGGSGLHYSDRVAAMLTFAAIIGAADGQNLFVEEVEGRSLHNAVNWAVVAGKFPELNLRYARRCPDGGDKPGQYDREHPDLSHLRNGGFSSWAAAYLMSPDVPAPTRAVVEGLLGSDRLGQADIHSAGSIACYAAGLFKAE